LLILISSLILVYHKIINIKLCFYSFLFYSIFIWAFNGLFLNTGFFSGDVLFFLLSDSFLFTLFFNSGTNYLNSSGYINILYAFLYAFLCFIMRNISPYQDVSAFALLISRLIIFSLK